MAGMDGSAIVHAIKETDPEFRVAVISGWSPDEVAERFSNIAQPDWIIGKPATLEDFQSVLTS